MPSGREIHPTKIFVLPRLDEDTLARMRAPPDASAGGMIGDDGSSSDEGKTKNQSRLPGTFLGSSATAQQDNSYY